MIENEEIKDTGDKREGWVMEGCLENWKNSRNFTNGESIPPFCSMLRKEYTMSFNPDFLDVNSGIVYAHMSDLSVESEPVERLAPPTELEYVFQLIRSSFLNIDAFDNYTPPQKVEDKLVHLLQFYVLSLPFNDGADAAQIEQWNDMVEGVSRDFNERREFALRGKCSYEQLEAFVRDQIEYFDYEDRERLDPKKMMNLIVFVYDYCMLTLREARLHPGLDKYVRGDVVIRGRVFSSPLRVCASVAQYIQKNGKLDEEEWPVVDYHLPEMRLAQFVQNPHASDSNISAMFVDLMHKFFLAFGLQKKGKTEWAKPERMLIYELLRLFGLCKSSKPAAESKYVTTVMKEYGSYFSVCNLRTWIRDDQAYCYLMGCSVDEFVRKEQTSSPPVISQDSFVEDVVQESEENAVGLESERVLNPEELPKDLREPMEELAGSSCRVTHTSYEHLCYASEISAESEELAAIEWDERLDYVMDLIHSSFEYVTFFPVQPQYLVVRRDFQNPIIQSNLVTSLKRDLLDRMDVIPRGHFTPDDIRNEIARFRGYLSKEDRAKLDVQKFYVLFLFIYDYVYLTYQESYITPYLRLFNRSAVQVCGKSYGSTVLIDDMLSAYLEEPFAFMRGRNECEVVQVLKKGQLYVPERVYPIRLESCSVKNMTAMFFDLFSRFFRTFGLSKRSDVKYASDQESELISTLACHCGICRTDKSASVRTMYMTNKNYFEKSSLQLVIRENEYGYLMLNTMSKELFEPGPEVEQQDR